MSKYSYSPVDSASSQIHLLTIPKDVRLILGRSSLAPLTGRLQNCYLSCFSTVKNSEAPSQFAVAYILCTFVCLGKFCWETWDLDRWKQCSNQSKFIRRPPSYAKRCRGHRSRLQCTWSRDAKAKTCNHEKWLHRCGAQWNIGRRFCVSCSDAAFPLSWGKLWTKHTRLSGRRTCMDSWMPRPLPFK